MSAEAKLWWRRRKLECAYCGKARLRTNGHKTGVLVCGHCDRGNDIADMIVRQWLNQAPDLDGDGDPMMRPVNCRCSILPFLHGHDLPKDLT